jgi:hypothetical protein
LTRRFSDSLLTASNSIPFLPIGAQAVEAGKITKTGDSYKLVAVKGAPKAKAAPKKKTTTTKKKVTKKKAAPKKKSTKKKKKSTKK